MIVFMVATLVAAGCTGPKITDNVKELPISSSPFQSNVTTIAEKQFWITVDPPGDHSTGDRFSLTGTTNLPPGDEILVEIAPSWFREVRNCGEDPQGCPSENNSAVARIKVNNQSGEVHPWRFSFDGCSDRCSPMVTGHSSDYCSPGCDSRNLLPGDYQVRINSIMNDAGNATHFRIQPAMTVNS